MAGRSRFVGSRGRKRGVLMTCPPVLYLSNAKSFVEMNLSMWDGLATYFVGLLGARAVGGSRQRGCAFPLFTLSSYKPVLLVLLDQIHKYKGFTLGQVTGQVDRFGVNRCRFIGRRAESSPQPSPRDQKAGRNTATTGPKPARPLLQPLLQVVTHIYSTLNGLQTPFSTRKPATHLVPALTTRNLP